MSPELCNAFPALAHLVDETLHSLEFTLVTTGPLGESLHDKGAVHLLGLSVEVAVFVEVVKDNLALFLDCLAINC